MLLFLLFLPVLSVRDVLNLVVVAPAADDAVGGAGIDSEGVGCLGVGLAVEFSREGFLFGHHSLPQERFEISLTLNFNVLY